MWEAPAKSVASVESRRGRWKRARAGQDSRTVRLQVGFVGQWWSRRRGARAGPFRNVWNRVMVRQARARQACACSHAAVDGPACRCWGWDRLAMDHVHGFTWGTLSQLEIWSLERRSAEAGCRWMQCCTQVDRGWTVHAELRSRRGCKCLAYIGGESNREHATARAMRRLVAGGREASCCDVATPGDSAREMTSRVSRQQCVCVALLLLATLAVGCGCNPSPSPSRESPSIMESSLLRSPSARPRSLHHPLRPLRPLSRAARTAYGLVVGLERTACCRRHATQRPSVDPPYATFEEGWAR